MRKSVWCELELARKGLFVYLLVARSKKNFRVFRVSFACREEQKQVYRGFSASSNELFGFPKEGPKHWLHPWATMTRGSRLAMQWCADAVY